MMGIIQHKTSRAVIEFWDILTLCKIHVKNKYQGGDVWLKERK